MKHISVSVIYHLHHHSTLYYQAGELLVNHMLRSEDFSTVSTVFFCVKKIIRMVHPTEQKEWKLLEPDNKDRRFFLLISGVNQQEAFVSLELAHPKKWRASVADDDKPPTFLPAL